MSSAVLPRFGAVAPDVERLSLREFDLLPNNLQDLLAFRAQVAEVYHRASDDLAREVTAAMLGEAFDRARAWLTRYYELCALRRPYMVLAPRRSWWRAWA